MALLSISTEEYTWLLEQFQLPEIKRKKKLIYTKHMEEVLRMHGLRSGTVFRNKKEMMDAMDNTILISLFRSTLNSSPLEVSGSSIDEQADLKALNWGDGDLRSVVTLQPEVFEPDLKPTPV